MPKMTRLSTTTRYRAPGFSLVELLVVIAIISVIAGILVAAGARIKEHAKESHARAILSNLMGNAGQYETLTRYVVQNQSSKANILIDWDEDKTKNINNPDPPPKDLIEGHDIADENNDFPDAEYEDTAVYDNQTNDDFMKTANLYIERFIWAAYQVPAIRKSLPALGSRVFGDFELDEGRTVGDGFLEVIDPWGNPIAYASSVSHSDDDTDDDADDDFLPQHSNPFFASAGADQRWGRPKTRGEFDSDSDYQDYRETDDYKFTVDNLYSFDLDRSASVRED